MKSKQILAISFSISLLIIALSFAYYLVYFLPNKQKTEQKLQLELYEKKTKAIQECIDTRKEKIKESRNKQCELLKRGPDCGLPKDMALRFDNLLLESKEDCIKQYSI